MSIVPPSLPTPSPPAPASHRARPSFGQTVASLVFHGGLLVLIVVLGGLSTVGLDRVTENEAVRQGQVAELGLTAAVLAIVVAVSAWRLILQNRRRFGMSVVALGLLSSVTLTCVEGLARLSAPAWPAIGLHGIRPSAAREAWGSRSQEDPVGINGWGQRDRPRTIRPAPGVRRIAFIGDSFLEEGSSVPVSVLVEQKLAKLKVEVVNLGVSASSPDEYFYRTREIALSLGATHCVTFLFAGNDFVDEGPTLPTYFGIAATYPRNSFLSSVGLLGINHLLTNRERPVIQAWLGAGDLRRQEDSRAMVLAQADVPTIRRLLRDASGLPPTQMRRLQARLEAPEFESFAKLLKAPDGGQFRSYYLAQALTAAGDGDYQWARNPEGSAFHWIEHTVALCQSRGVRLTVVIIPEAFQVDSRMVEQWKPLADMRRVTDATREASERLKSRAVEQGLEVIDLHDVLQDVPGTYLNFDGHWSDKGAEIVAEVLAKHLKP